jgi:hypothetical protein
MMRVRFLKVIVGIENMNKVCLGGVAEETAMDTTIWQQTRLGHLLNILFLLWFSFTG